MAQKVLTILDMQEAAQKKGGRCLSNRYTDTKTKLTWECAKGHIWQAEPQRIRAGRWCLQCARETQRLWNEPKFFNGKK